MSAIDISESALKQKQIDATVRLKRIGAMDAHFNAAMQYLGLDETKRAEHSTKAAHRFLEHYFNNATDNLVDLRTEEAKESIELAARHEIAQAEAAAQR